MIRLKNQKKKLQKIKISSNKKERDYKEMMKNNYLIQLRMKRIQFLKNPITSKRIKKMNHSKIAI